MLTTAFIIIAVPLVSCLLGIIIAGNKGRSRLGWGLGCLLFPLFGLLILLALPSKALPPLVRLAPESGPQPTPSPSNPAAPPSAPEDDGRKREPCPECHEMIIATAAKCKHCGWRRPGAEVTSLRPATLEIVKSPSAVESPAAPPAPRRAAE